MYKADVISLERNKIQLKQIKWNVKKITVKLTRIKEKDTNQKTIDIITRDITIKGDIDDAQRERLLKIADKCPVHRTLTETPRPRITSYLSSI